LSQARPCALALSGRRDRGAPRGSRGRSAAGSNAGSLNGYSRCYVDYLAYLIKGRERPLFLIVDRAAFHQAKEIRRFVCKHRKQLRIYFLPSYSPELNPDEHVWEEIKDKKLGRQVVQNKFDLKQKLQSALQSLQDNTARVKSFFSLPETKYAIQ
jgi:transposase